MSRTKITAPEQSGRRQMRVLHVEDDPAFAELAATFFERADPTIDIKSITNPEEALDHDLHEIECILSDYDMPQMNGIEFLSRVREDYPDVPFILFTGKGSEEIASEAISAGVTDYIQKESGTEQYELLANRIANAVDQYRTEERVKEGFQAIQTAGEGISLLDEDGRFTFVNKAYSEIYGYEPDELIGRRWQELYHEEDIPEVRNEILPQVESTGFWHGETIGKRKDGGLIHEQHSLTERPGGGLICTVQDITDRVEQRKRLEKRERTLQLLHTATQELIQAESAEEISQIAVDTLEEILDMPLNGVWLARNDQTALEPIAWTKRATELLGELPTFRPGNSVSWEVFESGEIQVFENVDDVADRYNPCTTIGSEIIAPLGDHGVINIGSTEPRSFGDTDMMLVETLVANVETALDRAQREKTIREEQAFTENVVESIGDILYVIDMDNELVRWNDPVEAVTGYSAEELSGKHALEFFPPDEHERILETINGIHETGDGRIQARIQTKDGDQIPYELTGTCLRDADGKPIGICGIGRDVTEQERQRAELERQNERLEQFASVVSHDLRTPMNVASGRISLARELINENGDFGEDTAFLDEQLASATEALDRMDSLLTDLLQLAREGKTIAEPERVSLRSVAQEAWCSVGKQYERASLVIDNPGEIDADPDRLQQLLENLFRNAVEHGGEDITVTVGGIADGFVVGDDGPGIPTAERNAVTDPGYTMSADGTGFGLAIVTEIAKAHDWDLTITESPAGGAQFEFRTTP